MERQALIENILKYLNYLHFSGRFSVKTSLNYTSDLNQYFSPYLEGSFYLNSLKNALIYKKILHLPGLKIEINTIKPPSAELNLHELIQFSYENSKSKLSQLSSPSRRRKLSALRNFSHWCLEQNLIKKDPLLLTSFSKIPSRLPEYLNLDEVMTYFKSVMSDFKSEPHKFKNELFNFLVLYGCGLRTEEACLIKIKEIDFENSRITIHGKGKKDRFAIMPEFLNEFFQKNINNDETYLYGSKPLNPRTAYNWIKKRALKAGLHKPVHPHMFRHSYATHLLRGKTDLRHLQELLGHSSLAATQRYTHLDREQLLSSLEEFHPLSDSSK